MSVLFTVAPCFVPAPAGTKPARYIGCEQGAQTPTHGVGIVSWLLTYPDTCEIGLPNQGLQILYEILNERERAYCGACTGYGIEHVVASASPPAGGSQGTGVDLTRGGAVPVVLGARPRTVTESDDPKPRRLAGVTS